MSELIIEPKEDYVLQPSDYEILYQEQRAENEKLKRQMEVARISAPKSTDRIKPSITAEQVKARLNPLDFQRMSRAEKLQSIGVEPTSITDEGLRKLFGRVRDAALANDLHKTNPARYLLLREAAKITDAYGA